MSLILDALRKSEAERQRTALPSLHSPAGRKRTSKRIWPLAGTVAALALVGGSSWFAFRTSAPTGSEQAQNGGPDGDQASELATAPGAGEHHDEFAASPAQGSLSTQPPLQREGAPMLASDAALGGAASMLQTGAGSGGGEWPAPSLNPSATAAAQPFQAQSSAASPAPAEPAPASPPATPDVLDAIAQAKSEADMLPMRAEGLVDPTVRASLPAGAVSAGASIPPPEPENPALPTIHELGYGIRRELPKMNMSMLVYAKDPQRRFALVNGKRYVPGGEAIEGKVLVVDVLPEGLVCEINGQRFLLPRQ